LKHRSLIIALCATAFTAFAGGLDATQTYNVYGFSGLEFSSPGGPLAVTFTSPQAFDIGSPLVDSSPTASSTESQNVVLPGDSQLVSSASPQVSAQLVFANSQAQPIYTSNFINGLNTTRPSPVPEPATWMLLSAGMVLAGIRQAVTLRKKSQL